jgi:hypothetical protein
MHKPPQDTRLCLQHTPRAREKRSHLFLLWSYTRRVQATGRSTAVRRGFDGDDRSACLTLPIMCYSCLSASTRQSMHDARMHRRVLYKSPCALPPILGFQPAPKLSAALRRCPFSRVAAGICPGQTHCRVPLQAWHCHPTMHALTARVWQETHRAPSASPPFLPLPLGTCLSRPDLAKALSSCGKGYKPACPCWPTP